MATQAEHRVGIESAGRLLAGVLYEPPGRRRASLLLAHPLFEERKAAQRALVELARALCREGVAVLRFDYRGCGDSPGAFADYGLSDWQADMAAARSFLAARCPAPATGAMGLRLGCNLAVTVPAREAPPDFLILWEPVPDGSAYLAREWRRRQVRQMMTRGRSRARDGDLGRTLAAGQSLDLDGYPVTARLHEELRQSHLGALLSPPPRALLLAHLTHGRAPAPAMRALLERLDRAGLHYAYRQLRLPPFWNLVGLTDVSELIAQTLAWLRDLLPGTPRAEPARTAACPPSAAPRQEDNETAWTSSAPRGALQGVRHRARPGGRPLVVFLHGWSGCRLGPHRMFVKTARALAAEGFPCLRFDFRGRGDSRGDAAAATIASMVEDARHAVAEAGAAAEHGVVLLGMCSGAKVAIAAAALEPAVRGLVLWSAEAMGELRAPARRQVRRSRSALRWYAARLLQPDTWRRLLAGRIHLRLVARAVAGPERASQSEVGQESAWLARFRSFRGPLLFVYGGGDPDTRVAAERYDAFCESAGLDRAWHEIADANHSFYGLDWEREVIRTTSDWLRRRWPEAS